MKAGQVARWTSALLLAALGGVGAWFGMDALLSTTQGSTVGAEQSSRGEDAGGSEPGGPVPPVDSDADASVEDGAAIADTSALRDEPSVDSEVAATVLDAPSSSPAADVGPAGAEDVSADDRLRSSSDTSIVDTRPKRRKSETSGGGGRRGRTSDSAEGQGARQRADASGSVTKPKRQESYEERRARELRAFDERKKHAFDDFEKRKERELGKKTKGTAPEPDASP